MATSTWVLLAVIGGLILVWVVLNMKTSRADGTLVGRVHPYRKMMFYIMPTRNESVVYFDEYIDVGRMLEYLAEAKERFDVDLTHAIVAACALGFTENPAMNHFVKGYRLYRRKHTELTFSMKRKRLDKKAKLSAVKLRIESGMTFRDFCEQVNARISEERSGKRTYADKEYDFFGMIPRALLRRAVRLLVWLDYHNVLPPSFIEKDPMYTSMFIANLGSLGMGAGFHHLYEWGTCPLFMMAGKIEDKPVAVDGEIVVKKILHVRFSYDERIDDGLTAGHGIRTFKEVMEAPYEGLGCLAEDGSDAHDLTVPRADRD
jgi:hypothetical protein